LGSLLFSRFIWQRSMALDLFEGRTGRRGRMGRVGGRRAYEKKGDPRFLFSPIRPILPLLPVLPSNKSRAMLRCQINRLNKTDVKEPYCSYLQFILGIINFLSSAEIRNSMLKCFTFLLKENELMMFSNRSVATIV
jgi:hypothetical protein